MKPRWLLSLAVVAAVLSGVVAWGAVAPGSLGDPVVTLSFLRDKFTPAILSETANRVTASLQTKTAAVVASFTQRDKELAAKLAAGTASDALVSAVAQRVGVSLKGSKGRFTAVSFTSGQELAAGQSALVMLTSGSGKLKLAAVDLTTGTELAAGTAIPLHHEIIFLEPSGNAITFTANAALQIDGQYSVTAPTPPTPPYTAQYTDLATALQAMGLFKGSGKGFELEREASRLEALVMMIRIMGEETNALAFVGTHPFTDVPDWGNAYVTYAYSKGWTQGVAATKFGTTMTVSADQYMTMMLRAMNYDDKLGDFTWDAAMSYAVQIGVLRPAEQAAFATNFKRDQMAYTSYYCLDGLMKNTPTTLQQVLIMKGAVTGESASLARSQVTRLRP